MKNVSKLVLGLGLAALALPLGVFGVTKESDYIAGYRGRAGFPVPVKVVSPVVPAQYAGSSVKLVFTVDKDGKPQDVTVEGSPDRDMTIPVVDAVKQWKFTPVVRNGESVPVKVVLPVRIVESL